MEFFTHYPVQKFHRKYAPPTTTSTRSTMIIIQNTVSFFFPSSPVMVFPLCYILHLDYYTINPFPCLLPIDGSALERLNVERPTIAKPRDRFVCYPGGASIPFTATPKTYNRPWSITADVVIPQGGAEGVLLANGGCTGGFTFFVKDQRLHFLYNWLGRDRFWLHSSEKVPEGGSSCASSSNRSTSLTLPRGGECQPPAASSTSTAGWSRASTCPTQS